MLFWNRWNQESAGRVYFNISREKPAHMQTWMDQSETLLLFFAETNQETILLQGSPELLISPLYMRRRALGRDWDLARSLLREWPTKGVLGNSTCHQLPSCEKLFSPLEWNYVTIESLHFLIKVEVVERGLASKWWWWWWCWLTDWVEFSLLLS